MILKRIPGWAFLLEWSFLCLELNLETEVYVLNIKFGFQMLNLTILRLGK